MAELKPAPFGDLVARLFLEPERQDTLFELPRRSWYLPRPGGPDMGVAFQGRHAGNPSGPASGPHTQMAQNLVLSYIAGGRIMELKTVQVNDRLDIPRPCIDMANVGYNVEWSQELLVAESLREYVAGMMLITILRAAHPAFREALSTPAGDVIHDISLGYDLEGIRSRKVQEYLDAMRDASALIDSLRAEIPAAFAKRCDLPYQREVSGSVTLSTFHGCPTGEIERICEFLLGERGLDVIVKMNPPTIGRGELEHLLHDVMGYREIVVPDSAYAACQDFDEAVEMCQRLRAFANARGRRFGCKFSNTLEVENHRTFFPAGNDVMYLSGPPLHVITITLADRFRRAVGPDVPISFSAGIDKANFPAAAACGFTPVTTCSDLLKTGGYGRLGDYLRNLEKAMEEAGAANLGEYILRARGQEEAARNMAGEHGGDPIRWAALLNATRIAEEARDEPRYRAPANARAPRRIDSHLEILDCITCNKCIPVCPNAANFTFPSGVGETVYTDFTINGDGTSQPGEPRTFEVRKAAQIANLAEFCNECGNCDTFCPEYGGPYIEKPSFHISRESYEREADHDGFLVETNGPLRRITGRIKGNEVALEKNMEDGTYRYTTSQGIAHLDESLTRLLHFDRHQPPPIHLDIGRAHMLRVLLEGILNPTHLNQINVALSPM